MPIAYHTHDFVIPDGTFATPEQGAKAETAIQEIQAGTNITIDDTDPLRPVISALAELTYDADKKTLRADDGFAMVKENADGGISLLSTTENGFTQQVQAAPWGGPTGIVRAANRFHAVSTGTTWPGGRYTVGITMKADADHANGPSLAPCPLFLNVNKANYETSETEGEIDGLYVNAAQGRYGDVGGILIGVYKQVAPIGATPGHGSITGIEIAGARCTGSALNAQQAVQVVVNYVGSDQAFETLGGAEGRSHGVYAESRGGQKVHSAFTAMEGNDFSSQYNPDDPTGNSYASAPQVAGSMHFYITGYARRDVAHRKFYVSTRGQLFLQSREAVAVDHAIFDTQYGGTTPTHIRLRKSGTTIAGQAVHGIISEAKNSAGTLIPYSGFYFETVSVTAGAERSRIAIFTYVAGAGATRFNIGHGLYANGVTGADKGDGSINAKAIYENSVRVVSSAGTTGGSGSSGAGNQYVVLNINGTNYKMLHDGIA